jgi:hypothetical protein
MFHPKAEMTTTFALESTGVTYKHQLQEKLHTPLLRYFLSLSTGRDLATMQARLQILIREFKKLEMDINVPHSLSEIKRHHMSTPLVQQFIEADYIESIDTLMQVYNAYLSIKINTARLAQGIEYPEMCFPAPVPGVDEVIPSLVCRAAVKMYSNMMLFSKLNLSSTKQMSNINEIRKLLQQAIDEQVSANVPLPSDRCFKVDESKMSRTNLIQEIRSKQLKASHNKTLHKHRKNLEDAVQKVLNDMDRIVTDRISAIGTRLQALEKCVLNLAEMTQQNQQETKNKNNENKENQEKTAEEDKKQFWDEEKEEPTVSRIVVQKTTDFSTARLCGNELGSHDETSKLQDDVLAMIVSV